MKTCPSAVKRRIRRKREDRIDGSSDGERLDLRLPAEVQVRGQACAGAGVRWTDVERRIGVAFVTGVVGVGVVVVREDVDVARATLGSC